MLGVRDALVAETVEEGEARVQGVRDLLVAVSWAISTPEHSHSYLESILNVLKWHASKTGWKRRTLHVV